MADAGTQARKLGDVIYSCTFNSRSMLFEVEAVLELNPAITVSDVVLTIGIGALEYCLFSHVVGASSGGPVPLYAAGKPSTKMFNNPGDGYYVIRQEHISADSLAVHSLPNGPQQPVGIETVVSNAGPARPGRRALSISRRASRRALGGAEHKLITAGGFYDRVGDYAALLREAAAKAMQRSACDFSISYDYGATLNALAKCFAVSAAAAAPADLLRAARACAPLFDYALGHYVQVLPRQYEIRPTRSSRASWPLPCSAWRRCIRATGCRRIPAPAGTAVRGVARFRDAVRGPGGRRGLRLSDAHDNRDTAYFDCQSAALLALTRAAAIIDDPRLPRPRSSAGWRPTASHLRRSTCRSRARSTPSRSARRAAATDRPAPHAFWNFKAGLALRFFAALRSRRSRGCRRSPARHADRLALFEAILRHQLARADHRARRQCIEIRTSVLSGETNSETQPWAMLGLVGHPMINRVIDRAHAPTLARRRSCGGHES